MTRPVQLSDAAYERLRNLKRPGESFSDIVLRLTPPGDLRALSKVRTERERREAERMVREIDALDEA